jgi:4-oxalocrotonate tautomerase
VPIINIKFIEGVVATPEQKIELVQKMTDTFVEVLGDVVRPFTYCIIDETPPMQWGIGGVPMPDLEYLTTRHMDVLERANELMREAMAQMAAAAEEAQQADGQPQPAATS